MVIEKNHKILKIKVKIRKIKISLTVGLFFPSVSWGTEVDEVEEVEGSDNFAGAMAMSSISKKTWKNNIEYKLKEKRTSQVLIYNKY